MKQSKGKFAGKILCASLNNWLIVYIYFITGYVYVLENKHTVWPKVCECLLCDPKITFQTMYHGVITLASVDSV